MSGVKGRSGRRPLCDEQKKWRVIEKAWEILREFLDSADITLREKAELSKVLASKNIPSELDIDQAIEYVNMPTIKKNGQPTEFDIGNRIPDLIESTGETISDN